MNNTNLLCPTINVNYIDYPTFNFQQWFFSSAMGPIRGWIFNAEIAKISEHLKICPYNVRTNHSTFCDHKKKDSKWENVMNSLISRLELKRKSEWFL